jgi:hypothetical protein
MEGKEKVEWKSDRGKKKRRREGRENGSGSGI